MVQDKIIYSVFIIVVSFLVSATVIIASHPKEMSSVEQITVEDGDCVLISYIGRYASNQTIFASSYNDISNMSNNTPFAAFISLKENTSSWHDQFTKIIPGLAEGIIGMKKGEEKVIGPIHPDKAFYEKPEKGDCFNSTIATYGSYLQEFEVMSLGESLEVWWMDVGETGDIQNPPKYLFEINQPPSYGFDVSERISILPPFDLFDNGTEIINITKDTVSYRLMDDAKLNMNEQRSVLELQWGIYANEKAFLFLNHTKFTMNDSSFTIQINPPNINQIFLPDTDGFNVLTIEEVNNETISVSIDYSKSNHSVEQFTFPRSLTFDRMITIPRHYSIHSAYFDYIDSDLAEEKLGLGAFAGEELSYEVMINKIFKKSVEVAD